MSSRDPETTTTTTQPLALPAPSDAEDVEHITLDGTRTFTFNKLGPVVVNSDGTLSRIANWEQMAPIERETTLRVLVARNKVRLANQEKQQGQATEGEKLSISNAFES
ncbi:hypothetical protein BD311DRAFT_772042 [Dichomitus squalens]|uniref:Uncharacterized protein n=1 Tax=Dichomitus squalens TaxID=114155 RepID=A0A4Q9M3Q7_9APHY|nr:hypothetical protein BD311DRAFT_772042 [Dichomitus squalens]